MYACKSCFWCGSDQPDWPPQDSAFRFPNGHVAYGSTGQRWHVQHEQWIRVKMVDDFPRRARLDYFTPEETAIRDVVLAIEQLGGHPILTDVVTMLGKARETLADWIDAGRPGGNPG